MDRMDQFLLGKPKYDLNHPAIRTGFESIDSPNHIFTPGDTGPTWVSPWYGEDDNSTPNRIEHY